MSELFKYFFNYRRSSLNGSGLPAWWSAAQQSAWSHCRAIQRLEILGLLGSCLLAGFLLERLAASLVLFSLALMMIGYGLRGAHSEAYCRRLGEGQRDHGHALSALGSHGLVFLGNGGLLALGMYAQHGVFGAIALLLVDAGVGVMLARQIMGAQRYRRT